MGRCGLCARRTLAVVVKAVLSAEGEAALGADERQERLLVAPGTVLADVHQHLALLALLGRPLLGRLLACPPLSNLLVCHTKVVRDARHPRSVSQLC